MALKLSDIGVGDKIKLKDWTKLRAKLLLANHDTHRDFEVLEVFKDYLEDNCVVLQLDEKENGKVSVFMAMENELEYVELVK